MVVKSQDSGHQTIWNGEHWVWADTGKVIRAGDTRACFHCGKLTQNGIDACIVPLVSALNLAGIETVASCCGHGKRPGNIILKDSRELMIIPDYETARQIDTLMNEEGISTPIAYKPEGEK